LIKCTRCGSDNVSFTGYFLGIMLKKTYYCKSCRKPFTVPANILAPKVDEKKSKRRCISCGDTERYHAKGLCHSCYARYHRRKKREEG